MEIRFSDLVLKSGGVSTPLGKERGIDADNIDENAPLDPERNKLYESLTIWLGYISQDRIDH